MPVLEILEPPLPSHPQLSTHIFHFLVLSSCRPCSKHYFNIQTHLILLQPADTDTINMIIPETEKLKGHGDLPGLRIPYPLQMHLLRTSAGVSGGTGSISFSLLQLHLGLTPTVAIAIWYYDQVLLTCLLHII